MTEKIKKIIPKKFFNALAPAYHFILSMLAAVFYNFPSQKVIIIGITGTAGKTSTSYLVYKMLKEAGYKTGLTSTAVFSDGENEWLNDKKMTMPGRFFIQNLLKKMVKNECTYAVVETTSEGIKQFRHRFINYDILIFTNLYPEHIESHGSYEKYREAKGELFAHLSRFKNKYLDSSDRVIKVKNGLKKIDYRRIQKTIIVNGDDKEAKYFLNFWSEAKIVYSLKNDFNFEKFINQLNGEAVVKDFSFLPGKIIAASSRGIEMEVKNQIIKTKLLGAFNAKNILAAYAVGLSQSISEYKIKSGLEKVTGLAGKMELISEAKDFTAIVDYSFEPKALENLYETIKLFTYNKLIHVLGSTGGGRDRSRRKIMGKLAAESADIVIVTNEDPYDEDPEEIIHEVAAGAVEGGKIKDVNLFMISDRREALKKAVELAENSDLVLATGKGAEQYICIANGEKIPWDDREEMRAAIKSKYGIDKT